MAEVPKEINDACQNFRQGDILEGAPIFEAVDPNMPLGSGFAKEVENLRKLGKTLPEHLILGVGTKFSCVISQTCDIVQDNKRSVVIAPISAYEDPDDEALAGDSNKKRERREKRRARIENGKSGQRPHIIHFDGFGDPRFPVGGFIDLKTLSTIQKPILANQTPARFIASEEARRHFAFRCAHIFERPVIADIFVDHVTKPLRNFLIEMGENEPEKLAILRNCIGEEWLTLDDPEIPHVGQLHFLADSTPAAEAQEILDEWWEQVSSAMPTDYTLLPNAYKPLSGVNLSDSRAMNLLTYWYLSDEG